MLIGIGDYRPILARKGSTTHLLLWIKIFGMDLIPATLGGGDIRLKIAFSLPTSFVRLPMLGRCS